MVTRSPGVPPMTIAVSVTCLAWPSIVPVPCTPLSPIGVRRKVAVSASSMGGGTTVASTAAAAEGTVVPPPIEEALTATFLLTPIGNSGVQGTGTLEGQARMVTLTAIVIGGTPGDLVTIHRGACDAINPLDEPDYIAGELDDSGLLREDVPVRLTVLVTGDTYSVMVYSGGDDFSAPLACGEIGNR